MKTTALTIINGLLLGILVPSILESYIMAGYKTQTMFAGFIGSVIGTIICTQYKIRNLFAWILLGIGLFTIAFLYGKQLDALHIGTALAFTLLLFVLIFFIGFSYMLAFFELFVAKQFSDKE